MKMSVTVTKTWCFRVLPVVFFAVCFYCYFYLCLKRSTLTSRPQLPTASLCGGRLPSDKWVGPDFNITRNTDLFLKLKSFFWEESKMTLPLPYGMKGSELFLLKVLAVCTNYEMPKNISKLDCRTCVVVGNGYILKNSSLGAAIDKYDVVIRVNDAPVRGYEDDVGSKTTMRLFYPESASNNPNLHDNRDTLMVLVPFKQMDLRWMKSILYNEKRETKGFWRRPPLIWLGEKSRIRVLDPYFLHQTASKLLNLPVLPTRKQRPVHPTTGILAIYVALNYCHVVHIAGFGYPQSANLKHPIHYYGSATMAAMKNSYHDVSHEHKVLKRLEEAGAIQFLHPYL